LLHLLFADTSSSGFGALGINLGAFIIQLISFVFVFLVLKKFAFKPITKMLRERRQAIDDSVRLGQKLEQERAKLDETVAATMRQARHEADQIIAAAHKESREIVREAEKAAQKKVDLMLADADERLAEEAAQSKKKLEKDLIGLVSEATETIVGEKVDAKKDAELVAKAIKSQRK
jgi:F-type H+-transporting ATPase subunit b